MGLDTRIKSKKKSKPVRRRKQRSPLNRTIQHSKKQKEKKRLSKTETKARRITDPENSKQRQERKVIPQNFNSYRHVITKSTTGDDLKWVLNLRDSSTKIPNMALTTVSPFPFGDKHTKTSEFRKTASEYRNIGNQYETDHLTRKRIGRTHANYSLGFFETGLRNSKPSFKISKAPKKRFWRYAKKDKKEYPFFSHGYKKERDLKDKTNKTELEIEKIKNTREKIAQKRKLPKLLYTAFEGRYEEAPLSYFERRNKKNSNLSQTYHLYAKGDLTTLKWEVTLRQKSVNPWPRKNGKKTKQRTSSQAGTSQKRKTVKEK